MSKESFQRAAEEIKQIKKRPSNDELLSLYALFKQGTEGDVQGSRSGIFDLKSRAKYDAWAKQKGKDSESARSEYVKLVESLKKKYS